MMSKKQKVTTYMWCIWYICIVRFTIKVLIMWDLVLERSWLMWTIWTSLSVVRERPLNLITHSLTPGKVLEKSLVLIHQNLWEPWWINMGCWRLTTWPVIIPCSYDLELQVNANQSSTQLAMDRPLIWSNDISWFVLNAGWIASKN